jgi:uncharacterized protein (DUF305 family)
MPGKGQTHRVKTMCRVLLVGLLALAGCSARTPGPTTSSAAASQFGGTDLAWIEINIAMDEQLLPLLELAPERSGSPEVQALSSQVQAFTSAEIGDLRALRDEAGLSAENPHEGMPMPGMVTPQDVTEATALTGKTFDTKIVKAIEAHLDQSRSLAGSEEKSGVEPRTRALALQVLRTREAALATAKGLS